MQCEHAANQTGGQQCEHAAYQLKPLSLNTFFQVSAQGQVIVARDIQKSHDLPTVTVWTSVQIHLDRKRKQSKPCHQ